ncbi:MAG TPA: MFS transporter [Acidimicrobiales bacterium]|nr:MFS transporter [Acidimicrobiales bacterium]
MAATARPDARQRGLRQAVAALRYPDYAKFWTGALISNCGTWMQNITVPYVIYLDSHSAWLVGVAGFAQFIPAMFLGPVGGSLADRYSRKSILLLTQTLLAVLAFALWGLYIGGFGTTPVLILLVFLSGVVGGINVPAWQAFVTELVPRDALLNAITLNSAQFNAARAVGPAIAGVVLGRFGPSWAFLFNGISFVAVLVALVLVHPTERPEEDRGRAPFWESFRESLAFTRANTGMLLAVSLVAATSFLGMPLFQLMPVFARDVFHVGAGSYGIMLAAMGVGGVFGAVVLGSLGNIESRGRLVRWALVLYALSLAAFGAAPSYVVGMVVLVVLGAVYLMLVASLNTSVQMLVPERLRGRAMALYIIAFTGAYPIGALVQGALADRIGAGRTVLAAGAVLTVIAVAVGLRRGLLGSLDDEAPTASAEPIALPVAEAAIEPAG